MDSIATKPNYQLTQNYILIQTSYKKLAENYNYQHYLIN